MSLLLQLMIVGLIVLYAAGSSFRRLAPARAWQWQARLSYRLEHGVPAQCLRAKLGRRLRPAMSAAAGCHVGCKSCNGCG